MALTVRLYNINSKNTFTLGYSTHPKGTYTTVGGTYDSSNTRNYKSNPITVDGLNFDTEYWFKITDSVTGRNIIENIRTNDSKAFECYDRIDVDVTTSLVSCGVWVTKTITVSEVYPNNASNGKRYNIYSGTTANFATAVVVANQTPPPGIDGIIHSYNVTYPNATPTGLVYFFIEHSDGRNVNATNKKQGGYEVRAINLTTY